MTKSKFKVGDKVKIILEDDGSWKEDVRELIGKIVIIQECCAFGVYKILEDNGKYRWNDYDFELIEEDENNMMKYKAGDRVVLRKDLMKGCEYGNWYVDGTMVHNIGQTVTIDSVIEGTDGDYYILTDGTQYYTDEMINHLLTKELQHAEVIQKHIFDKLSITKDDFQKDDEIFVYGIDENGYYKKLSFSDIAYGKVAVRCDTLQKSKEYLQFLESFDVKWVTSDKKPTELCYYDTCENDICYMVNVNDLSYIDLSDALELDLKIYDYVVNSNAVNNEEGKECNTFNKSDSKSGHVIRTRDGYLYIFMKNEFGGQDYIFNQKTKSHMELFVYNEDLTLNSDYNDEQFDIIEVYEPLVNYALKCVAERAFDTNNDLDEYFKLVYKREEPKKMTLREIEEQLGYKIKLI